MTARAMLTTMLAVLLAVPAAASAIGVAPAVTTSNVEVISRTQYTGGTEIAWDGPYVYTGELNGTTGRDQIATKGGIHIFDVTQPAPVEVGFVSCPGSDNDVVVVRPGLIAVAHHKSTCNPRAKGNGIYLVDVTDPAAPRVLGGVGVASAHTLTPKPGTNYIYVHPGGLAVGGGVTSIVDISDVTRPRVAATFTPSAAGCHDLQFLAAGDKDLAFCASGGAGEVQTWDVSDPVAPKIVGRIVNPAIQFPHNAVPSPDGKLLVINDEAFAAHECSTGTSVEGSLWAYDITDPTVPVLAGRVAPPASRAVVNAVGGTERWCTAHNYNFVPGTRTLAVSWFTGGTTIENLDNPAAPQRVAHYQPDDADAYTAHWFDGRVWVNDMNRGLEVLRINGLAEGQSRPVATPPEGNAAAQALAANFTPSLRRPRTAAERGPALFCNLR
jgi:hypothetical protein